MRKSQRKITYIPDSGELDTAYCSGRDLMDATKAVVSTLSRNAKATLPLLATVLTLMANM